MLKKISILGCGWLGLPLAKTQVKLGHQVKGSTTTAGKLPILAEDGIQPFLLDLNELLSGAGQQDFFCSEILVINVPPKRKSGNNYRQQMINLAEHLRHTEIRKILLVSSTSVYAPSEAVITEESALDENGAADLIAVENLFRNVKNWQT
ncbi:MAG TPA: hypothetical protein VK927_11895, partial [Adhaeribacter sp.]|nr:hypothetical protein [Adhaeribacter sp.]